MLIDLIKAFYFIISVFFSIIFLLHLFQDIDRDQSSRPSRTSNPSPPSGNVASLTASWLSKLDSPLTCWRRLKGLEEEGYIQQYTALLDREKLGFSATGFAHVSLENHHQATVAAFDKAIEQWPEVMECYMTSGNYDYMLKIVAVDMTAFERFLSTRLLLLPAIRTVNTSFVLRPKKYTTALPLD